MRGHVHSRRFYRGRRPVYGGMPTGAFPSRRSPSLQERRTTPRGLAIPQVPIRPAPLYRNTADCQGPSWTKKSPYILPSLANDLLLPLFDETFGGHAHDQWAEPAQRLVQSSRRSTGTARGQQAHGRGPCTVRRCRSNQIASRHLCSRNCPRSPQPHTLPALPLSDCNHNLVARGHWGPDAGPCARIQPGDLSSTRWSIWSSSALQCPPAREGRSHTISSGSRFNYFGHEEWTDLAPAPMSLTDAVEIRGRLLLAF